MGDTEDNLDAVADALTALDRAAGVLRAHSRHLEDGSQDWMLPSQATIASSNGSNFPAGAGGPSALFQQSSASLQYHTKGLLPELMQHSLAFRPDDSKLTARWRFRDWLLGTGRGQWVGLWSLGFTLVWLGTFAWMATGGDANADSTLLQSMWMSWGLFFDPGTQTGVAADAGIKMKVVAVMFSVLGFIFNLALLGLIVDQVRDRLARWQLMRNRIVLNGHTLILGWGERTLFLLSELLTAYQLELSSDKESVARIKNRHKKLHGKAKGCCAKRRRVIIMANKEAIEMEQEAQVHLMSNKLSAAGIYFWTGDPTDWKELEKVSPQSATDIIVLGRGANPDASDQHVLQILLALAALPQNCDSESDQDEDQLLSGESFGHLSRRKLKNANSKKRGSRKEVRFGDVWAEMRIAENVRVAPVVLKEACGIVAREAVNRLLCLTVLEPAVGLALLDVVSFMSGDQLYLTNVPPGLAGKSFAEACLYFPSAVLVGVHKSGRNTADGVAPSPDTVLDGQDELVFFAPYQYDAEYCSFPEKPFIAEDPDAKNLDADKTELSNQDLKQSPAECICIIGCPSDFSDLLRIMNLLVTPFHDGVHSEVHILSERNIKWRQKQLELSFASDPGDVASLRQFTNSLGSFDVQQHFGPISSARHLAMLPLSRATSVMILSEVHGVDDDPTASDTRNLNTIITIKKYLDLPGNCKVICELLDARSEFVVQHNRELQMLGKYFYSNKLETAMFAMAAQNRCVFNTLMVTLQPHNALDIIAVPISLYIRGCCCPWKQGGCICPAEMLNFWQLHARVCSISGGVLLGWQRVDFEGKERRVRRPNINPPDKLKRHQWFQGSGHLIVMRREIECEVTGPGSAAYPIGAQPGDECDGKVRCSDCCSGNVGDVAMVDDLTVPALKQPEVNAALPNVVPDPE